MTYKKAKRNADIMGNVIKHNLATGGNAKIAYNACEPEVQALIRCGLTHTEKRVLGIVGEDEPDHLEVALRTMTRERQERMLGQDFDVQCRLKTAKAKRCYDCLKAA